MTRSHCANCGQERPFHLVLQYEVYSLYSVFGVVWGKNYFLDCSVCGDGKALNRKKVEAKFGKVRGIPFMEQYGFLVGIALMLVLVFLFVVLPEL